MSAIQLVMIVVDLRELNQTLNEASVSVDRVAHREGACVMAGRT